MVSLGNGCRGNSSKILSRLIAFPAASLGIKVIPPKSCVYRQVVQANQSPSSARSPPYPQHRGTIRDKRINLENKFGKFIMKRIDEIYFSSDKVLSDKSVSGLSDYNSITSYRRLTKKQQ